MLVGQASGQDLSAQYRQLEYSSSINENDPSGTFYRYSATNTPYTIRGVASDFGRRYLRSTRPNDWHGGVDFNNTTGGSTDMGDLIVALNGGVVSSSSSITNSNYKYLFINGDQVENGTEYDFGYGHIFRSPLDVPQIHGSSRLVRLKNNNRFNAIVIPFLNAQGLTIGYRAISSIPNDTVIIRTGNIRS